MKVKFILPALLEATDPGLPTDQIRALPAARARVAGRLSRSPTTRRCSRTSTSMPLDLDDAPDLVVMSVYITSAQAGLPARRPLPGAGHPCRARRPACQLDARRGGAPRRHDLHRPGRGHAGPRSCDDLRRGEPAARYVSERRTLVEPRRSGATSSTGGATCARTRSSSHAAARTTATSATRTRSTGRDLVLHAGRRPGAGRDRAHAGTHVYFLDDHLLGNPRFARRCSRGCAAWAASSRAPARSTRSCGPT